MQVLFASILPIMKSRPSYFMLLFVVLVISTCTKDVASNETISSNKTLSDVKQQAIADYAKLVYANYYDCLISAQNLKQAIDSFVANPNELTHQAAKQHWLFARKYYSQSEAFRFYGGPIDAENGIEGRINAWPLDEAYIDYVAGDDNAGIINNNHDYPNISSALLSSLNEQQSETNICTGFHAVEFLLWGQDHSLQQAGTRHYTDFSKAKNHSRRKQYLTQITQLLVDDLKQLVDAWAEGSAFRSEFISPKNCDASFAKILNGLSTFCTVELVGERMTVALNNRDMEDEQSCFSDNTHNDIIQNFNGIIHVLNNNYTTISGSKILGVSINQVIKNVDPKLYQILNQALANATQKTNAIQTPFDAALVNNTNNSVANAITSLKLVGSYLQQTSSKFSQQ